MTCQPGPPRDSLFWSRWSKGRGVGTPLPVSKKIGDGAWSADSKGGVGILITVSNNSNPTPPPLPSPLSFLSFSRCLLSSPLLSEQNRAAAASSAQPRPRPHPAPPLPHPAPSSSPPAPSGSPRPRCSHPPAPLSPLGIFFNFFEQNVI